MRDVDVLHTGGRSEKGADIEIHIRNPFAPSHSWVVVVQLKDFDREIGPDVADQLEQAITERQTDENWKGELIGVILASTRAGPSEALKHRMAWLADHYHIPVSCVYGKDFNRVLAKGMLIGNRQM
jgi:hypothetical protein